MITAAVVIIGGCSIYASFQLSRNNPGTSGGLGLLIVTLCGMGGSGSTDVACVALGDGRRYAPAVR